MSLTNDLFLVPLEEDRFLVYAPLRQAAFIGNSGVARRIQLLRNGYEPRRQPDPWMASMVQFLAALGMINEEQDRLPVRCCEGEPQPLSVTLFLTNSCNLRCRYCYASSGESAPKFMSLETAKSGIDFVFKNATARRADSVNVGFHGGGEPSLNWTVLKGGTEYARELASHQGVRLSLALATNGVLSDDAVDWVTHHITGATVSFDGLPEIHDRNRMAVGGGGTSGQVMHTMQRLDEAQFPYGVRATVLADQVDALPDSVDFICSNFQAKIIQVEPVYLLGRGAKEEVAVSAAFVAAFRAARSRAEKHGRELHFSAARVGSPTNHFCCATTDSFCLTADGNVSSCFEAFSEDSPLASIFVYGRPGPAQGSYEFDHGVLARLRAFGVENRRYCKECFAKWDCAGDCIYKALSVSAGGEVGGAGRCEIIRELTKDMILKRIADSGGPGWGGRHGLHQQCRQAAPDSRQEFGSVAASEPAMAERGLQQ